MPLHNFRPPSGRIATITVDSRALACNVLGDPTARTVALYLPAGYDESGEDYPLFVCLAGFTGSGLKHLAWQSFGESLPQRVDRLIGEGKLGPVVVAFPDCFTSLGGNQYVNSSALGLWEDFLLDEMLPAIEAGFRVRRGAGQRVVFGKSSGGYGALMQGLRHGERWAGVACHSGDMGFDIIYRRDLPTTLGVLAGHDGSVPAFLEHLRRAVKIRGEELHALMTLAMAATYDPDPGAPLGVRLPVDPATCELLPERWQNWLDHDPLLLIDRPECQASLRQVGGLFIDCGSRDQYQLQYPARGLTRKLTALGIEHRFETFDDDHSGIDYRMDRSLPFLYAALEGA